MLAALTLTLLLTISLVVVRIASVALRLTGLTEDVARFQSLSALTGTGFTTHEAEMIVNYPLRRKILSGLMVFGNLGIVSISATFIVTFAELDQNGFSIASQALLIVLAIAGIIFMATNRVLDRFLCGWIAWILYRFTALGDRRYQLTLQLDDEYFVAEHAVVGRDSRPIGDLPMLGKDLTVLCARIGKSRDFQDGRDIDVIHPGSVLVCYGSRPAHDRIEDFMASPEFMT